MMVVLQNGCQTEKTGNVDYWNVTDKFSAGVGGI